MPSVSVSLPILLVQAFTRKEKLRNGSRITIPPNGTDFTIQRRSYPAEPYPWDNNPYDYWNVWVNGNCSKECFPSLLERFDIVIMKHCYTAAKIEADINAPDIASDRKSIENYKLQYRAIRDLLDGHPETKFIVFTLTPRHRLRTYAAEAGRAKVVCRLG